MQCDAVIEFNAVRMGLLGIAVGFKVSG